jgi:hypothetical protein
MFPVIAKVLQFTPEEIKIIEAKIPHLKKKGLFGM